MRKIKLLPSLKEKKHYLVFKGDKDKVEKALYEFLGVLGFAKAAPLIVESKKGYGVLSFNRQYTNEIRAAFSFYHLETLGISGTIKKAKQKFLKGKL
jgi:RNase P/RNase MRP subunit POP5